MTSVSTLAAPPAADLWPGDQYRFADLLTDTERAVLVRLRAVLDAQVRPLLDEYWERGEFPSQVLPHLIALDLMEPAGALYAGFRNFELARTDCSVATMYNAQSGLFRTAVRHGGSPAQAAELDPKVRSFALAGVFALTEPEHGSDIAGGLATTARRDGGTWVIDGAKRWIGGADAADVLAIFARDIADGQVKAFLVAREAEGVVLRKIGGKTSLRMMQNFDIDLQGVRVDDAARLGNVNSFRDVAGLLRRMRSDVAWIACGVQAGAYEAALAYTTGRVQFGRPVAGFQLVQEKLARMLANLTASLGIVVRLTQLQDRGVYRDEDSAGEDGHEPAHARDRRARP
jgi:glutaryl-CoA dehydrogenase